MSNKFVPHRRTETQERTSFSGKLLFVVKETYLDYSFIDLENGTTVVTPVERDGYRFYVESREVDGYGNLSNAYISTRLFTICSDGKSILRGDLHIGETTAVETNNALKYCTYVPVRKNTKLTIRKNWNVKRGYNFYMDGEPFGFISEFGEYEDYHENAEGLMQFFFEDIHHLVRKTNKEIRYFKEEFKYYEQLIRENFPNFKGNCSSVEQLEIVGVTREEKPEYLVKKNNLKDNTASFYIIRHISPQRQFISGEAFEMLTIDPTRLCYSCGCMIKHYKYKHIFYADHKNVGSILNYVKGFGIDTEKLDDIATIKTLHTCIFIRDELVEYSVYTNQ